MLAGDLELAAPVLDLPEEARAFSMAMKRPRAASQLGAGRCAVRQNASGLPPNSVVIGADAPSARSIGT